MRIDLGSVTAYSIAVKNGFTGTEAEWMQAILNAGENAQDAAESAQEASESAQEASESAMLAENSATSAEESAEKAKIQFGSPLVAHLVSDMEDENRVYVYVGEETGYTTGDWYYYDGSEWTSGGSYNAEGVNTDSSLSIEDMPADAKAVGDEFTNVRTDLKAEIVLPQPPENIVQGTFNTLGAVVENPNRIRITGFFKVQKGSRIDFNAGTNTTQLLVGIFNDSKVYQRDSQWYSDGDSISVENDGYYIFVFRKNASNPPITPSEYDAITRYIPPISNGISTTASDVNALTEDVRTIWYGEEYQTSAEWNYFKYDFKAGERYAVVTNYSSAVTAYTATKTGSNIESVPVNINGQPSNIFMPTTASSILKLYGPQTPLTIKIIKLDTLIQELIDITSDDDVPGYYLENNYLENKVNGVINKSPLDGLQFAFLTDVHCRNNAGISPKLIKYLKNHTNAVPFVVFGGDIMTTTVPEGVAPLDDAETWQSWLSKMGKSDVYQVQGNHDYLVKYYDDDQQVWYNAPLGICRQFVIGNLESGNIVSEPGKLWYYFDVPTSKTRVVVLNDYDTSRNDGVFYGYNGMSVDQVRFVVDKALNVDDMRVIFISHQTYDANMEGENQSQFVGFQSLFKAIANHTNYSYGAVQKDFTNSNIKFVAHLCGHWHADASHVDDGVLTIQTTCDALYGDGRTAGTITEQAFDVVTVDFTNSKLYTTRIGAGSDREFTI